MKFPFAFMVGLLTAQSAIATNSTSEATNSTFEYTNSTTEATNSTIEAKNSTIEAKNSTNDATSSATEATNSTIEKSDRGCKLIVPNAVLERMEPKQKPIVIYATFDNLRLRDAPHKGGSLGVEMK